MLMILHVLERKMLQLLFFVLLVYYWHYIGNKIFADYFNQYAEIVNNYGYKVKITNGKTRSLQADKLGANAGFFKKSAIIVTPEWVY